MAVRDFTLHKTTVTSNTSIAPGVYLTRFERKFSFVPGQVIGVTTSKNIPSRLYSLCSGKDDSEFEILYNIVENGLLTPKLKPLLPGDCLYVTEPFGTFIHAEEPVNWLASGTGIAPYVSMLRSGISPSGIMIQGARRSENFFFAEMLKKHFSDRYVPCCSGGCDGDGRYFKGRLTSYLEQATDIKPDELYYLCGSVDMVIQSREILMQKGVLYDNIRAEIYF